MTDRAYSSSSSSAAEGTPAVAQAVILPPQPDGLKPGTPVVWYKTQGRGRPLVCYCTISSRGNDGCYIINTSLFGEPFEELFKVPQDDQLCIDHLQHRPEWRHDNVSRSKKSEERLEYEFQKRKQEKQHILQGDPYRWSIVPPKEAVPRAERQARLNTHIERKLTGAETHESRLAAWKARRNNPQAHQTNNSAAASSRV